MKDNNPLIERTEEQYKAKRNEIKEEYYRLKVSLEKELKKKASGFDHKKRIADLRAFMLRLQFELLISYAEEDKRVIDIENLDKRIKSSTRSEEKRIIQNSNNIHKIENIMRNPNVDSELRDTFSKDLKDLKILDDIFFHFKHASLDEDLMDLYRYSHPDGNLSEKYEAILDIIHEVLAVFYKIKNFPAKEIKTNFEEINNVIKDGSLSKEVDEFKRAIYAVNTESSRIDTKADVNRRVKDIKITSRLEHRINNLPKDTNINKELIKENLETIRLIEVISLFEELLRRVQVLPSAKIYGSVRIDYSKLKEEIKKAERLLKAKKNLYEASLADKGVYEEIQKIDEYDKEQNTIQALTNEYEKLLNCAPSERREIENEIEMILLSSKISMNKWDLLKMEAEKKANAKKSMRKFEESVKKEEKDKKEEREIAIANRFGVSEEDFERIKREVFAEAERKYPPSEVVKGGEGIDLNEDERNEFVNKRIGEMISELSKARYDQDQRDKHSA